MVRAESLGGVDEELGDIRDVLPLSSEHWIVTAWAGIGEKSRTNGPARDGQTGVILILGMVLIMSGLTRPR
ncbi:hypothetical protein ACFWVF_19425 [Streptomyces sp. NPDC058659]|uniref:hypothetical protein n=1 Tax=unclassified Streptomyces TaxID=2593676 RepID=UPI00365C911C